MPSDAPHGWHAGGCHCGAVRFRVFIETAEAVRCNCSMCAKRADIQLLVPAARFEILSGEDQLSSYRFNTAVAVHRFCRTCGIHSFNTPRSNPDGIAVNIRCLDGDLTGRFRVTPFDGQHWEQSIDQLR